MDRIRQGLAKAVMPPPFTNITPSTPLFCRFTGILSHADVKTWGNIKGCELINRGQRRSNLAQTLLM
jgi:hypothetical protein